MLVVGAAAAWLQASGEGHRDLLCIQGARSGWPAGAQLETLSLFSDAQGYLWWLSFMCSMRAGVRHGCCSSAGAWGRSDQPALHPGGLQ